MKIFVSGKVGQEIDSRTLMDLLRSRGHEVTFDWTTISHLRPYEDNRASAQEAAVLEIEGVKAADLLIVLAHEKGVGLYVELGAALALATPVIVRSLEPARSMFFFHPLVTIVRTDNDLLREVDKRSTSRTESA
jgi:hypothetical protein